MAMIKCQDCDNDISDVAVSCPHCGRPTANQQVGTIPNSSNSKSNGLYAFEALLTLSGRRNRLSYLILRLFTYLILVPIMLTIFFLLSEYGQPEAAVYFIIGFIIVWTPVELATMAQRFRDVGWTGWTMLLLLFPILNVFIWLALFFLPGTRGPNRYGEDPLG